MTEKRGFSSLLDSRFRIDVEPLSHLLAELYPSKLAPSLPTPAPAFNPLDPRPGVRREHGKHRGSQRVFEGPSLQLFDEDVGKLTTGQKYDGSRLRWLLFLDCLL